MKYLSLLAISMVFVVGAFGLSVGDTAPGLDGFSIDNSADYLGPWLDIQDYYDAGKCVVVVCWKQS